MLRGMLCTFGALVCLLGCVKKSDAEVKFAVNDPYNTTVKVTLINALHKLPTVPGLTKIPFP